MGTTKHPWVILLIIGVMWGKIISSAYGYSISLVGGPVSATPLDGAGTYSQTLGLGGGIILDSNFRSFIILENKGRIAFNYELGGLYIQRKFVARVGDSAYYFTSPEVQVQLLGRLWFSPAISIGGGLYTSSTIGQIEYTNEDGTFKSDPTTKLDYGPIFSLRYGFNWGAFQIFLDGRVAIGLANVTSDGEAHYENFQLLFGIRIGESSRVGLNGNTTVHHY